MNKNIEGEKNQISEDQLKEALNLISKQHLE